MGLQRGVIAVARFSHQRGAAANADWAQRQAVTLLAAFHLPKGRVPSESPIRRALQRVDGGALDRASSDRVPVVI